jgi:hypothetical protein
VATLTRLLRRASAVVRCLTSWYRGSGVVFARNRCSFCPNVFYVFRVYFLYSARKWPYSHAFLPGCIQVMLYSECIIMYFCPDVFGVVVCIRAYFGNFSHVYSERICQFVFVCISMYLDVYEKMYSARILGQMYFECISMHSKRQSWCIRKLMYSEVRCILHVTYSSVFKCILNVFTMRCILAHNIFWCIRKLMYSEVRCILHVTYSSVFKCILMHSEADVFWSTRCILDLLPSEYIQIHLNTCKIYNFWICMICIDD